MEAVVYSLADRLRPWATVKKDGLKESSPHWGTRGLHHSARAFGCFSWCWKFLKRWALLTTLGAHLSFIYLAQCFYVCVCLRKRASENECVCVQCWIPAESISIFRSVCRGDTEHQQHDISAIIIHPLKRPDWICHITYDVNLNLTRCWCSLESFTFICKYLNPFFFVTVSIFETEFFRIGYNIVKFNLFWVLSKWFVVLVLGLSGLMPWLPVIIILKIGSREIFFVVQESFCKRGHIIKIIHVLR